MSLIKINDKASTTPSHIANGKTRVQAKVPSQLKQDARPVIPLNRIVAITAKMTVVPLLAMMMSACQSSPSSLTAGSQTVQSVQNTAPLLRQKTQDIQAPALAKTALVKALNRQRRSSYAYHINALASNETYRSELAAATPQQLAMSDDPETHCTHVHDEAYIDMLERAELAGVDIEDDQFTVRSSALKAAYLECQTLYYEWEMAHYDDYKSFDLEDYLNLDDEELVSVDYEDEASTDVDDAYDVADAENLEISAQLALEAAYEAEAQAEDDAMLAAILAESEANEASKADDSQTEFLPRYDSSHTRLDKRQATLLNDYLLEPLTLTSQGVYRPLSGQLSIMPTMQYKIRNHQAIGQHYIYVNAKEGAIYVWADTLALTLSYYLDDKLGTQMHNKWIKLDLNDGSLPEGFGRDFIKSHFSAIDNVRANSAVNEYGFISTATLLNTGSKPHSLHAPYLAATPKIIERRMDKQSIARDLQTYRQTLYQQLTDKYPELRVTEANTGNEDDDLASMIIITEDDAEAIDEIVLDVDIMNADVNNNVVVVNTDATTITTTTTIISTANSSTDSDTNTSVNDKTDSDVNSNVNTANDLPKSAPINSLLVIKKLLALIKVDDETDDGLDTSAINAPVNVTDSEDSTATTAVFAEARVPTIAPKNPNIDYAAYTNAANSDTDSTNSPGYLRDVYGLDNRQNIQWHLRQYQNPASDRASNANNDTLDHLTFEALTRYSAISPLTPMFAGLPQGANMPNADNTINFSTYSQDLIQRYENGEGPERGKMIIKTIKRIGGGLIR